MQVRRFLWVCIATGALGLAPPSGEHPIPKVDDLPPAFSEDPIPLPPVAESA